MLAVENDFSCAAWFGRDWGPRTQLASSSLQMSGVNNIQTLTFAITKGHNQESGKAFPS